jgi:hypothetical protein
MAKRQHPETGRDSGETRMEILLDLLVDEVVERLVQRGTIPAVDESPRRRKEHEKWRDDQSPSECSDPTEMEPDGESSSLRRRIKNAVSTLRQNAKRSGQSDSPSRNSQRSRQ